MNRNFLSEILAAKRQVVARFQHDSFARGFRERALEIRRNATPHRLLRALEADLPRLKIIAEFKRKSPSLGIIRDDLSAADVARRYERGGACAISVLTDEEYFGGSLEDLSAARSSAKLPVLRKDFIIDPIQIYEAAVAGADAVLLIVAALDDALLGRLREVGEDELGLDALVEVHTSGELRRALDTGAKIIGANNRNLKTFQISLNTSERLIAEAPPDSIMISESGLQSAESLCRLRNLGFRGFLIGEALMRAGDPETALRDLTAAAEDRSATGRIRRGEQVTSTGARQS
jgi:indole-3-glycerol phosphate synthase